MSDLHNLSIRLARIETRLWNLTTQLTQQDKQIMATLAEVQASQAAEDTDIKNLIAAFQTTQADVTALQAQIAALQAAGGASPSDLDALKADADAAKASIDAALAPATPAPAPAARN